MNKLAAPQKAFSAVDHSKDINLPKLADFTFVLFGATGDLAKRKIFPALYNLFLDGKIALPFSIIGLGRSKWTDYTLQKHVKESLKSFSRRAEMDRMEEFLTAFRYCSLDVTEENGYKKLLEKIEVGEKETEINGNRLFYLSVAPKFIDVITTNINKSGLGASKGWKRLIIEKPFGHDLKSARELNEKLSKAFAEDEIYRIDHYLGKPMVQSLESLKAVNPLLHSLFNENNIANIQITASETVGVEERAGYYDQAGAIRDMFQNHLLQLLMMTAMQLPQQAGPEYIREEKRKIMESLRPLTKGEAASHIVRGQYAAGEIEGEQVAGYKEETGVREDSTNDTFVAARLWIEDGVWNGVPFYIRTGKRMEKKATRIVVEFKNGLKNRDAADRKETAPNLLVIEVSPQESISLRLNVRNPSNRKETETISLTSLNQAKDMPEAYESLIYDALRGDLTFFAHWKEVELSWQWVQPVLEAFNENSLPLHLYRAGSMGPEAADQLLKEDGFHWW